VSGCGANREAPPENVLSSILIGQFFWVSASGAEEKLNKKFRRIPDRIRFSICFLSSAKGLEGVAIADLMKELDLTVGGFYKHFDSRDHLVVESLRTASGPWQKQLLAAKSGGPPLT
jgi:Bacterial regulatory proteins, tetR family